MRDGDATAMEDQKGGETIFPGCRKERAGECVAVEVDQWGKIPRPKVFHVNTKVFHVDTKINLFARK
jgi:hypothetical protein